MREHRSIVGQVEPVRVRMLGVFSVSVGNRALQEDAWRLRKAASLVKLLTLAPGHRLHREQVMDLLWPDSGRKAASNNLRGTLHALRRSLAASPTMGSRYLVGEDEALIMCPSGELWVDVEAFEEAAATARRAQDPAPYRAALDLYGGELLPGDRYENWAEGRREELRRLYLALLLELASIYEERNEREAAIETLQRAVAEEPVLEEAHAGLMRLYALSDRQTQALAQYDRLRKALSERLGMEPSASSRHLYGEIAAGRVLRNEPSAPAVEELPDANNHNLPASRSSFVGREREMLEVKRELAMTRLLTLTGAGGSGKTRLALEVARELVGAYPDGVRLVELAPLSEEGLVPQTVAGALGVLEQPDRSLTHTLAEALQRKQTLLVMDNCEHLIDATAHLSDALLDSCPRLRILATSREALGIAGETVWLVPPLSVPEQTRSPSVEELEGYESARLLVERARRRNPTFTLTPENAEAVAEICRGLEGLPLAIELAAARVGLSAEEIAARLEDSLQLLTGGSRTALPRQQTLRGALDWSYELLSELEQKLFRGLSVFAGGCTLGAAEVVGAKDGIEAADALNLLSGLVDKSLVVAEANGSGGVRYRMLEPLRQYAREKLEEDGEAEKIRRRHAEFFLSLVEEANLVEEAKPWLEGPEQADWFEQFEIEHDNLRVALSWALEGEDPEVGLRLASGLSLFWDAQGYFNEGARWLEEALAIGSAAPPRVRAGALDGLAAISRMRNTYERAVVCHEAALALYEELGDFEGMAKSLADLGLLAQGRHDAAQASTLLEKSLAVARQSGDEKLIHSVLSRGACIAFERGDFEQAQRLWTEDLAVERKRGNASGVSSLLFYIGYAELARGNNQRATELLEESLDLNRGLGRKWFVSGCLGQLGIAATLMGDPNRAKTSIKEALGIDLELGEKYDIAEDLAGLGEVASALGDNLRAARLWGAAKALREILGYPTWSPAERAIHDPQLVAARSRLDEKSWEAAFAEGQAMSFEDAVEYALSEAEPATNAPLTPRQHSTHKKPPTLTCRESEVAHLVAQRLTNRQIASELVLSEHTVHHHVTNLLKKLNLNSREQVASHLGDS